jgi:hypothetical protein
VSFNPEEFLRVPVHVVIGQQDTGTTSLRATDRANEQQGVNRLERARNWVDAMREAAFAHGIEPAVTLTEVAGIEHSFKAFCEHGALVDVVGRSLFDDQDHPVHLSVVTGNPAAEDDDTPRDHPSRSEN